MKKKRQNPPPPPPPKKNNNKQINKDRNQQRGDASYSIKGES